jgi:myosin-5
MRYFATADDQEIAGKKKKKHDGSMTEVEEQILGKFLERVIFGNTALIM